MRPLLISHPQVCKSTLEPSSVRLVENVVYPLKVERPHVNIPQVRSEV